MFNNYRELFEGYVEFYKTSLWGASRLHPELRPRPQRFADQLTREISGIENSSPHNGKLAGNHSADCSQGLTGTSSLTTNMASSGPHYEAQDIRLVGEPSGKVVRVGDFNGLETADIVNITTVFIALVLAKRMLSAKLASSKRLEQLGLRSKDRERLDECIWRLLYYSFSSAWLIQCCLKHKSHLLLTSNSANSLRYTFELDWSSYTILIIEAAFYLHATYALVFEDVWRRDSPMMLVHHLAAVFTTLSIYSTRTHQIGLVSTVLRDTCDVLLEATKLIKCLHIQHGKRVQSLGRLVNCFLIVFALAFAINQLYYFPLFCLYHGLNMIKLCDIQTPVMAGILTCGLIFLLLDIVWFLLILRLLYFMMLSGKPLKDLREYDDEDEDIVDSTESDVGAHLKAKRD